MDAPANQAVGGSTPSGRAKYTKGYRMTIALFCSMAGIQPMRCHSASYILQIMVPGCSHPRLPVFSVSTPPVFAGKGWEEGRIRQWR